jgi:hypothetical protein
MKSAMMFCPFSCGDVFLALGIGSARGHMKQKNPGCEENPTWNAPRRRSRDGSFSEMEEACREMEEAFREMKEAFREMEEACREMEEANRSRNRARRYGNAARRSRTAAKGEMIRSSDGITHPRLELPAHEVMAKHLRGRKLPRLQRRRPSTAAPAARPKPVEQVVHPRRAGVLGRELGAGTPGVGDEVRHDLTHVGQCPMPPERRASESTPPSCAPSLKQQLARQLLAKSLLTEIVGESDGSGTLFRRSASRKSGTSLSPTVSWLPSPPPTK